MCTVGPAYYAPPVTRLDGGRYGNFRDRSGLESGQKIGTIRSRHVGQEQKQHTERKIAAAIPQTLIMQRSGAFWVGVNHKGRLFINITNDISQRSLYNRPPRQCSGYYGGLWLIGPNFVSRNV